MSLCNSNSPENICLPLETFVNTPVKDVATIIRSTQSVNRGCCVRIDHTQVAKKRVDYNVMYIEIHITAKKDIVLSYTQLVIVHSFVREQCSADCKTLQLSNYSR